MQQNNAHNAVNAQKTQQNESTHVCTETRDTQLHPPRCTRRCRSNGTDGFLTAPVVVCEVAVVAAALADSVACKAGMTPLLALRSCPNWCPAHLDFMHGCKKAMHRCTLEIPGIYVNIWFYLLPEKLIQLHF